MGIGIKFDKDPLAVEQNNYLTKIVNVYTVCDLDAWQRDPTKISKLIIAYLEQLIQQIIVIKIDNSDLYSRYGITFVSAGSWSFDNDFGRNVITFWC